MHCALENNDNEINAQDFSFDLFSKQDAPIIIGQSTPKVFFFSYTIEYNLDLTKKELYVLASQWAAKLKALKV